MKAFELSIPDDLAAALRAGAEGSSYKAAGIDLIDRMQERVDRPKTVVDLLALERALRFVRHDGDVLELGALATLQQIADAPELAGGGLQALREACGEAATPQVRRRATLGGNLLQKSRCWYLRSAAFGCLHGGDGPECLARSGEHRYHAVLGGFDCVRVHPSNAATALCALGATAVIAGPQGERELPIRELWPKAGLAALAEHTLDVQEVLVRVRLPAQASGGRSAYRESREKQSFDWPTAAAAVQLGRDGDRIATATVCLGAVAPVPWIAEAAAAVLVGARPERATFTKAADAAFADAQPLLDNAYKIDLGKRVLIDALLAASED